MIAGSCYLFSAVHITLKYHQHLPPDEKYCSFMCLLSFLKRVRQVKWFTITCTAM